jgi:hypothetical protein
MAHNIYRIVKVLQALATKPDSLTAMIKRMGS